MYAHWLLGKELEEMKMENIWEWFITKGEFIALASLSMGT